jgi:hypothetical protein
LMFICGILSSMVGFLFLVDLCFLLQRLIDVFCFFVSNNKQNLLFWNYCQPIRELPTKCNKLTFSHKVVSTRWKVKVTLICFERTVHVPNLKHPLHFKIPFCSSWNTLSIGILPSTSFCIFQFV